MALFRQKTPEEKAAAEEAKRVLAEKKRYQEWLKTPQGRSRTAYERGDVVFQAAIVIADHYGSIEAMVGGSVDVKATDPTQVLNYICAEGWDLITGTVVFAPGMQESRDKFLSSGQQVAISGTTIGYYLFRRRDQPNAT